MTVREVITQSAANLKTAGVETPGLDASILLAYILNTSRTALIAAGPQLLPEETIASFRSLIDRRLSGECTAYITGKKEFRNLLFTVNPSVLVPRPDTETLVSAALEIYDLYKPDNKNVLDLCTGSGAVAVSLKHEKPEMEVYASDISVDALEVAKQNASRLLGENQILFFHSDLFAGVVQTDLIDDRYFQNNSNLDFKNIRYSLIVSNPPYIPSDLIKTLSPEVQKEPRIALDGGFSGLEIIKRIINETPKKLTSGGSLVLEADPSQMEDIYFLFEKKGFRNINLYKDLSGDNRVIGGIFEY
jgi:release factor glutamine methyltransferase